MIGLRNRAQALVPWRRSRVVSLLALAAFPPAACTPSDPTCVDCFDTEGYQLELSDASGSEPPAAVLFSGWRNGRCQDDVVCTGTSDIFLGDVRWGPVGWSRDCSPEDQEVIAFAGGHQPSDATPRTSAQQAMTAVPVAFSGPMKVDVKLWVVPKPLTTGAQAEAQAAAVALVRPGGGAETAQRVFADLGTGIDLSFSSDTFPIQGLTDVQVKELYGDASCDLVGLISGRAPRGYDGKVLNVYYVDELRWNRAGLNCHDTGPGGTGQNVMFVDGGGNYSPIQLAHELGHALGLLHAAPTPWDDVPDPGHVDEMYLDPYLALDNLMRSGGAEVGQVTLGQIYRMHYDKLSWKWIRPGAPTAANGYPRECQNSPVEGGLCPPLTLHATRGWP